MLALMMRPPSMIAWAAWPASWKAVASSAARRRPGMIADIPLRARRQDADLGGDRRRLRRGAGAHPGPRIRRRDGVTKIEMMSADGTLDLPHQLRHCPLTP